MRNKPVDWLSIAQFAFSLLAVLGLWGLAFGAALIGLLGMGEEFALPGVSLAIGAVGLSLLLLPSTVLALLRLLGSDLAERTRLKVKLGWWPLAAALLLLVVLLLGNWAVASGSIEWLALPVLHFLAVGLPILLLVYLGMRRLPPGSLQRRWGLFDSGLALSPLLIIIAEMVVLAVFAAGGVVWITTQPELMDVLRDLASQMTSGVVPDKFVELIGPLLLRPGFIAAAFVFVALIVPLIEEALKPVGMWFLHGRLQGPAAGFVAGLLSGAGYAMFESLVAFNGGEEWVPVTMARMGTAVVHITVSGLVGWALVGAWRQRRYLALAGTYLAAVAIHGTWNAMTVILVVDGMAAAQPEPVSMPAISALASAAPFILIGLGLLCITLLMVWNRRLQPEITSSAQPPAPATPAISDQPEPADNVL
jgi:RsiW-degrading membrane proteinase PrsW (M82 family)